MGGRFEKKYFSYIVAVPNFIGGGNQNTRRIPSTGSRSLQICIVIRQGCIEYTSPRMRIEFTLCISTFVKFRIFKLMKYIFCPL